jgi:SAM-dependent methyltransferase
LAAQSSDIKGNVLEIGDNLYTLRFGGDRVTKSDILDVTEDNPRATYIADLAHADSLPSDAFDCILCTQTLQLIFEVKEAVRTLHRLLKPGGTLLVTFPCISKIACDPVGKWGDCWRFTSFSAMKLFEGQFLKDNIQVKSCGNVLAAVAFLHGLAAGELDRAELDYDDDEYQVLITVRAVKQASIT